MVPTTLGEKGTASLVNILLFECIVWPLREYVDGASYFLLFLAFQMLFLLRADKRDIGMLIVGSSYEKTYPLHQRLLYTFLYSLSVVTVFFPVIFAMNMLMQIVCIMATGTTVHGYLAGDIRTVRPKHLTSRNS